MRATASCSAAQHLLRVLPAPQQHRPLDRVDRPGARHRPAPRRVRLDHLRDVAHQDRRAAGRLARPCCRCRRATAGSRGRARPAPTRRAAGSRPTSRRSTPPTASIRSFSVRPALRSRPGSASTWYSFWKPPKLTTSATPGARIRCLRHHPVLPAAQLAGRVAVALQRVLVDLPDRRVVRPEVRRDAVGHLGVGQPFGHLLPRPVDVDVVLEGQDHLRQPERRDRPLDQHARRAGQRPLDRDGHLLLDLLRRLAGVEGDHHDLDVGDVRERLDLQLAERDDAEQPPGTASRRA